VNVAVWTIEKNRGGEGVTLRYSASALPEKQVWQPCGACEVALVDDLLAWVSDQAEAADIIKTPEGAFVKLFGPGGGPAFA
jgi:hypothetical protein